MSQLAFSMLPVASMNLSAGAKVRTGIIGLQSFPGFEVEGLGVDRKPSPVVPETLILALVTLDFS